MPVTLCRRSGRAVDDASRRPRRRHHDVGRHARRDRVPADRTTRRSYASTSCARRAMPLGRPRARAAAPRSSSARPSDTAPPVGRCGRIRWPTVDPLAVFSPETRAWFEAGVRRADAGAGARLAGDRVAAAHADPGADRLGQDARRLPLRDRPARRATPGEGAAPALRLAAEGAELRHRAQPPRAARRARVGAHASASAPATRRRGSARRCCASRRTS